MDKLAQDAVNRAISYHRKNPEKELSLSTVTEGIILGESKRYKNPSDIPNIHEGHSVEAKDFKFSTTKGLFEKVGLKDCSNYYKKLSNFHSLTNLLQKVKGDEYGFRLLFQWEKVNDGYTKLEETPSNEYKYLLMDLTDAELKKKQDKILQKVNNKDPGELEERLKIILQQIRQDAEQNAKELSKHIKDNFDEIKKLFDEIKQPKKI